jgi:hypothetical protein
VAEAEKRYEHFYNNGKGWKKILIEIKKLVKAEP